MIDSSRVDTIVGVWREIHNNWAQKSRLEVAVVAPEVPTGKSLEELKALSFKVGVNEEASVAMNVEELTAFYLFMKDQINQLRAIAESRSEHPDAPPPEKTKLSSVINFSPSDDDIRSVLSSIQFTVHVPDAEGVEMSSLIKAASVPTSSNETDKSFGLTKERVDFVGSLVGKKIVLASRDSSVHFRIYPPAEFLSHPIGADETSIYDRLKETTWWVRWKDDQYDQLRFIEVLVFIHQIISAMQALKQPGKISGSSHHVSKHAGGWQPPKDRNRKVRKQDESIHINVKTGFSPSNLVMDETIRLLLSKTVIESSVRPPYAVN